MYEGHGYFIFVVMWLNLLNHDIKHSTSSVLKNNEALAGHGAPPHPPQVLPVKNIK